MKAKDGMKTIIAILSIIVMYPIWYYLLYNLLKAVNASELNMFLFWVYVPVSVLIHILSRIADAMED